MSHQVLIVSTDSTDVNILKEILKSAHDGPFDIEWVNTLSDAIERLEKGNIDIVLADLFLADSQGVGTFDQLFLAASHTPIVVIVKEDNSGLAEESIKNGAQAYLTKGYLKNNLVPQALRSIIQRKALEQTFHRDQARAEIALNSISDAVICTDLAGNVDYLNIAAEAMTLWTREEASGHSINEVFQLINGDTREPIVGPVEQALKKDSNQTLESGTVLIRKNGSETSIEDSISPIHDWEGKLTGAVIVFHDVTLTKSMSKKMEHLAHHDFLTNLPNRVLLSDRIVQAIALAKRGSTQLAVLFLDLDNFKYINDSLGHETGDKLLQSVTRCLSGCVRSSDTVSRQGGDELSYLPVNLAKTRL